MFFFFARKRESSQEENDRKMRHEKHTQMGFELLTSRVTIQHVSTCAFREYLEVLNLSFDKKNILPFLTAAQRKHVQIHVMKTCRQASVTNSLLTLNFFCYIFKWQHNPEWIKVLLGCSKPRLHSHHKYFVNEQCLITSFHNLYQVQWLTATLI